MLTKQGIVTSAKMQGTVTVTVHRRVVHPLYRKQFRCSKKFLADSAGFHLGEGDEVRIVQCRPLSKRKCFRVTEVVKQAPRVSELVQEAAVEQAVHREKHVPQGHSSAPSTPSISSP